VHGQIQVQNWSFWFVVVAWSDSQEGQKELPNKTLYTQAVESWQPPGFVAMQVLLAENSRSYAMSPRKQRIVLRHTRDLIIKVFYLKVNESFIQQGVVLTCREFAKARSADSTSKENSKW
jgi:hypothetical protein